MARSPTATTEFLGDDITTAVLSALGDSDRDVRAQFIARAAQELDPDALIGAVADPVNAVRRNAAMDALARGGPRSVPTLVRALDSSDDELVMFSAGTLGRSRDRSVIPHLVRLLSHRDTNVVQTAIEGLSFLRARGAVEPLVGLLDRDPWLRVGAVQALGEIGDPRAVEPVARFLADEDTWTIATEALGKLRSLRAVAHLADALFHAGEPDFDVPLRALAAALRRSVDPARLAEVEPWLRLQRRDAAGFHARLAKVLARADGRSIEAIDVADAAVVVVRSLGLVALYPALLRSTRDPRLAASARLWTLAIGPAAAPAIAECTSDTAATVRALACRCAGALYLGALGRRLEEALGDVDPQVRAAAAQALAQVGASGAAASIAELLLDPDPAVADAAGRALAGLDPAATSAALLALPRDNVKVVAAMLRAMRARPHAHQLAFVLDALHHGDAEVRRLAIEALAVQHGAEPIDALLPCLEDPEVAVRRATVQTLAAHRTTRARDALLARLPHDPECAVAIVGALLATEGEAIVARLVEMSWRESRRHRAGLVEELATLADPVLEPLIVDLLASADVADRRTAVRAMSRLASPAMFGLLLAAATDGAWQVRLGAAEQLGRLRDAEALAELERLCLDDHPLVARAARYALDEAGGE